MLDGSAGSLAWRLSSGLDTPSTPCCPKWRIPWWWRTSPRWYIVYPAAVARPMLERRWGDWRPQWRSTGIDACQKGALEKSALAEHAWKNHHPIKWEEASVVDRVRTAKELLVKEAIHIRLNYLSSTGMGAWSCLDAKWWHWRAQEAELIEDLRRQLTVPVTALDEMQGYI